MARALCNASLVSVLSEGVTRYINRRGYSAATTAVSAVRTSRTVAVEEKAAITKEAADKEAPSAWVPDPATGYYKPENRMDEIDASELREMLLSSTHKPRN